MLRILAISSQVACGHVGLSAIQPAAQALGAEIIALPSVILSNHPGHAHAAGQRIAPDMLESMLAALEGNGWLAGIDCVLTGYLPSAEHVCVAAGAIARVKGQSPGVQIICDPVIGDETEGVYVDIEAATAIRAELLTLADMILPNAFELGWLTGLVVDCEETVLRALQALPPGITVLATSVPTGKHGSMANVFCASNDTSTAMSCRFNMHANVPKGTGDFFSGLIAAGVPFDRATAQASALAELSIGRPHLAIAPYRKDWFDAVALPTLPVTA